MGSTSPEEEATAMMIVTVLLIEEAPADVLAEAMMIISRMEGIPMAAVMIITPDPVVSRMTALAVPMENTVHLKGKKALALRSGTETN